jgi:hypothetical protein
MPELSQMRASRDPITDTRPHRALARFASMHPDAEAVQLVHTLRQEEARPPVVIADAARWLGRLSA